MKSKKTTQKKYGKEIQYLSFLIQCNLEKPLKKELLMTKKVVNGGRSKF